MTVNRTAGILDEAVAAARTAFPAWAALQRANALELGLGGSVWGNDREEGAPGSAWSSEWRDSSSTRHCRR
jgi:acyl-CoA reductase-like NAD-dependent aldehyde dehydrogenase